MGRVVKSVAIGAAIIGVGVATGGIGWVPGVATTVGGATVAAAGYLSTTTLGSIALGIGSGMILGAVSQALAPRPSAPGATPQNYRQSLVNTQIIYGKARVGGPFIFYHATQGKKEYRYFVIALAGHPVHAITRLWLGDEAVTIPPGGGAVSGSKYAGKCWIWPELGEPDATANSTFVAECGGRWTADHRGRGIAKLYVKFELADEVIAAGMPTITAEVEGKRDIYDPRTGARGYANNAALCFYDWLLLPRSEGGFGAKPDSAPWDYVAAQANICDELVPLKGGGSERRYTCDGLITVGAEADNIRDPLLGAMAGRLAYSGGYYYAAAGAFRSPNAAALSEGDLVGSISVSPLSSADRIANEAKGTFNDPRQLYQPVEFPTVALATGDDLRTLPLDLPFTKSHSMAQRIAKIELGRRSAEKSVTWPMNARGLPIRALDTVRIDTARYGLANYTWTVAGWSLNPDFSVTLSLREEDPDWYAWNPVADEQDLPVASQQLAQPTPWLIGAGEAPLTLTVGDVGASTVSLSFTLPAGGVIMWRVHYAQTADFSVSQVGASGAGSAGQAVTTSVGGLDNDTTYYFWAQAVLLNGALSPPSAPASAKTDLI